MHIGFTGTQGLISPLQDEKLDIFIQGNVMWTKSVHHGLCVGADFKMHVKALRHGFKIIGHPPINTSKMVLLSSFHFAEMREPKEYLVRNRDIVDETTILLAVPKGMQEEERSGTWATVRYARKLSRPIMIFWPDGKVTTENLG